MAVRTDLPVKETTTLNACQVCDSNRLAYLFSIQKYRIVQCADCGLLMMNPQPSGAVLDAIYGRDYFFSEINPADRDFVLDLKKMTADFYLDSLEHYGVKPPGRLLEVGCGQGELLAAAKERGFQVTGVDPYENVHREVRRRFAAEADIFCGRLEQYQTKELYDVCVLSDVLEHVRNPRAFLERLYGLLKPRTGVLLAATPSLDSWSAKSFRRHWMEFKLEHLFYFDRRTLGSLLWKCGFTDQVIVPGKKFVSADYIAKHFERYPIKNPVQHITCLGQWLPKAWRHQPFSAVLTGIMVFAKAGPVKRLPTVSVLVPVYNEAGTIEEAMNRLIEKQLDSATMEIIVVESGSTDGTREILTKYNNLPNVKLIFQPKPLGKGNAIRQALRQATGEVIVIQDADLEYDLEDYAALLEPVLTGRRAFVLGSRHGGKTWKIRDFTGNWFVSLFFNLMHWLLCGLMNRLYGLNLRDPFTMFKVFRRDCLYGLHFECNRFDFDYELLIKLVRRGYRPMEVPVNYHSRTFKDGKKISVLRDPWTWLWALLKYRFVRITANGYCFESLPHVADS